MIVVEYTVVCDGCGRQGPSSGHSHIDAQFRAQADAWTCNGALPADRHWCPECTQARKEQQHG